MTNPIPPDSGTGQATPAPTKKMGDLDFASQIRDLMAGIAREQISNVTSTAQKGRVVDVDFVNFTALVWFPGDETATKVNLFTSTLPGQWGTKFGNVSNETSYIGRGSQVIVENFYNKLYITEVLTGGQFSSEWAQAGRYDVAIGSNVLPEYARTSEWVFRPIWKGTSDPSIPGMGGPFAINIGPFVRDSNVDGVGNSNDKATLDNGAFEIDLVSLIGSRKYEFMASPVQWPGMYQIIDTTPNGYGGSIDAWYRLMPNQVSNDAGAQTGLALNAYPQPQDKFLNPTLGDWDNSADTLTTLTVFNGTIAARSGNLFKIQSNTSHAVLKVQEGATNRIPVLAGISYYPFASVSPTVTTTDVRMGIDWYTAAGAFISSVTTSAVSCASGAWTDVFATTGLVAPATAAFASQYIQISGTPLTSTIFYASTIALYESDNASKSDVMMDIGYRQTIHGSKTSLVTDSQGEIWFRIYMPFLGKIDADQDVSFVVRIRNTDSFLGAKSLKTGLPVYEYDTAPVAAVGYVGITDAWSVFSANNIPNAWASPDYSSSSGTWRNPDLLMGYRGAASLSAGGDVTYDGTNLKWTSPFEIGGLGRSFQGLTLGYGTIACPTSGTIPLIPDGSGLAATVTVTSLGIPIVSGQALYYCVPPGVKTVALPTENYADVSQVTLGGFVIVDSANRAGRFTPPEWWILIGYKAMTDNSFKCMDGNLYGGNVNVGDVNTHIIMPGSWESGDEVFGTAIVSAGTGATAPFGQTTVSYAALTGTGTVTVVLGANATAIGTNLIGYSYSANTATSTIMVINRTTASGTQVSYRIKRIP